MKSWDIVFSPTDLFTILKPQNSSHDVLELNNIRRSPDLEALKLLKSRSGSFSLNPSYLTLFSVSFAIFYSLPLHVQNLFKQKQ